MTAIDSAIKARSLARDHIDFGTEPRRGTVVRLSWHLFRGMEINLGQIDYLSNAITGGHVRRILKDIEP